MSKKPEPTSAVEVAAPQPTAVSASPQFIPNAYVGAWDQETDAMIGDKMPLLKIRYPGSIDAPEGAVDGDLYNNLTGEFGETKRVVLLKVQVRQAMMEKYDPRSPIKPALCESLDGLAPSRGSEMQAGPCRRRTKAGYVAACPMLQWSTDARGGRVPPPCSDVYVMLLWDIDNAVPLIFSVKKTGIAGFKKYKSQLKFMKGQLADPADPTIPVNCSVAVVLGTKHVTAPGVSYYVPTFDLDLTNRIPTADARAFAMVADDLGAQLSATDTAEITQTDDDTATLHGPGTGSSGINQGFSEPGDEPLPF